MPVTHDMVMHFNQMQGFYRGLSAGRIYPRWQEETNSGFGAPTTVFYPPAIYYFTSLLYFFARDWLTVLKATYLMLMVGSGIAVFQLARRFYTDVAALAAMVAYLIAPYHLLNHYQRGALAECLSFTFMPLTLLFAIGLLESEQASKREILRRLSGLALCSGLFVWSHPPTAYQLLLIGVPIGLVYAVSRRRWLGLSFVGLGLALGLTFSSAYLLPAVMERSLIHSEEVERTWPYHESYVWDLGNARYDHSHDAFVMRIDRIWLLSLVSIIVLGGFLLLLPRLGGRMKTDRDRSFLVWLIAGLFASFMMLRASHFVGVLIPGIEIGVFAWRMLSITSLVVSLLVGYVVESYRSERGKSRDWFQHCPLVVRVFVLAATALFSVFGIVLPMYRAEAFVPNPKHSNHSLVPVMAAPELPIRSPVALLHGSGDIFVERWEPEYRTFRVNLSEPGQVAVRTFNYPGWTARTADHPLEITTGSIGEIQLSLPAGSELVTLEFVDTPVRRVGSWLTVFAVGIMAVILCWSCGSSASSLWEAKWPNSGSDLTG